MSEAVMIQLGAAAMLAVVGIGGWQMGVPDWLMFGAWLVGFGAYAYWAITGLEIAKRQAENPGTAAPQRVTSAHWTSTITAFRAGKGRDVATDPKAQIQESGDATSAVFKPSWSGAVAESPADVSAAHWSRHGGTGSSEPMISADQSPATSPAIKPTWRMATEKPRDVDPKPGDSPIGQDETPG